MLHHQRLGVRVELTFRGIYIPVSNQLKYPNQILVRGKRIELLTRRWQRPILPLNYTRIWQGVQDSNL